MSNEQIIFPVTDGFLERAAQILRTGGIVAFPTETVYGLGADAFNARAVAKIFEAKGRPRFDPLIVHISSLKTLEEICDLSLLPEQALKKLFLLAENFWPGPLSIVLPKSKKIPGIVTAGLSTVAVRFPSPEAAQKLIALAGGAVAAPSANPFGSLSPTKAEHVLKGLGEKVDLILDGGASQVGVESSVLDLTGDKPRILRHGGLPKEAIEKAIGEITDASLDEREGKGSGFTGALVSPGQLKSHYAPKTRLCVFSKEEIISLPFNEDAAYLFFDAVSRESWLKILPAPHSPLATPHIRVLSLSGSTSEAAACLFEALHEIDSLEVKRIYAQLAPQEGLGAAINDRLRRAAFSVALG